MMTPKPDMTLLPPDALLAMADVMTRANTPEKHKDAKWKRMTPEEHIAASLRHTFAWLSGEKNDPELGTSHLANASVRMSMALSLTLAPLAHSTSLRSPLRADALRDPLRGYAPATTGTTYTTQHWWLYQDKAGWEGNYNADGSETKFRVGDKVVDDSYTPPLYGEVVQSEPCLNMKFDTTARKKPIKAPCLERVRVVSETPDPEPEFKVGDRVLFSGRILDDGVGTVVGVSGDYVRVVWDEDVWDEDKNHAFTYLSTDIRHAPNKTLDDFTPDQWDTAADRSKDIWAETKV